MVNAPIIGKVYKLHSPNTEYCYIGSTHGHYTSVRLAQHRQAHRRKTKDYKGLFDQGDPIMEILATIDMPNGRDDTPRLRELEEFYEKNTDKTVNVRRCFLTSDEKYQRHIESVEKYHSSPLGKLSQEKASCNAKLKRIRTNIRLWTPTREKELTDKIIEIESKQSILKVEQINLRYPPLDQSAST